VLEIDKTLGEKCAEYKTAEGSECVVLADCSWRVPNGDSGCTLDGDEDATIKCLVSKESTCYLDCSSRVPDASGGCSLEIDGSEGIVCIAGKEDGTCYLDCSSRDPDASGSCSLYGDAGAGINCLSYDGKCYDECPAGTTLGDPPTTCVLVPVVPSSCSSLTPSAPGECVGEGVDCVSYDGKCYDECPAGTTTLGDPPTKCVSVNHPCFSVTPSPITGECEGEGEGAITGFFSFFLFFFFLFSFFFSFMCV
jgi:hypothetical protein